MFNIVKYSDQFDAIVPADYRFEKLATGYGWSEGPVWDEEKDIVYYTDFTTSSIYSWNRLEGACLYRRDSGWATGLAMDDDGNILCAESKTRRITRMEKDGSVTTLASHYRGRKLNSPNDVIVKSDGTLYFTDPHSDDTGNIKEQQVNGLYKLLPGSSEPVLLADFSRPNGLAFSPDEKLLYVDDTNLQTVYVFVVTDSGELVNGRLFARLDTGAGPGAADGMKVDIEGNIYVTGPGGISVYSPGGEKLGLIDTSEIAANLCWGGSDWKTMYITATTSLYSLHLNIAGIPTGKSRGGKKMRNGGLHV